MKKLCVLLLAFLLLLTACTPLIDGPATDTGDFHTTVVDKVPNDGEDTDGETSGGTRPIQPGEVTGSEPEPPTPPAETSEGILDPDDPNLPKEENHTDEDDNGLCDDCGISVVIVLDLLPSMTFTVNSAIRIPSPVWMS